MSSSTKVGAGIVAGFLTLLTTVIGLPLLVLTGMISSGDPLVTGGLRTEGIPPVAADAYQRAAAAAHNFVPPCEIPPWILAGVGEIETGHGTFGGAKAAANGDVSPPIVGPALPDLGDDTDDGVWDGSTTVDHAVGPMQFIPATWRAYGLDGNADGVIDPHNMYDATLAAAAYLCASAPPMATEDDWRAGLLAYNHSTAYVADVLAAAYRYRDVPAAQPAAHPPGGPVSLVDIPRIGLTNVAWAPQVQAMLAAAAADGLNLTGGSYRDPSQQIALREANCGTSAYAIYEMPSSQCSPPTARPGSSMHELGLAIDFNNCSTHRTACFSWLEANAAGFGIYNLPSEPWHWSQSGS